MSYILDALRRADAERERGAVPGLHAQPLPQLEDAGQERALLRRPSSWMLAGGVVLLALAALAWYGWGGRAAPPADGNSLAPPVQPQPMPIAPPPAQPPGADPIRQAAPTPPVGLAPPGPRLPPLTTAAPPRAAVMPAQQHQPVAAKPAPASAAEERIYAPADLPDEVRRSLPQLAIGGSVYSEAPGSRLLIVNGQPLHEGDQPAPGVVLERIKLKSAVMSYKGYRYEISY